MISQSWLLNSAASLMIKVPSACPHTEKVPGVLNTRLVNGILKLCPIAKGGIFTSGNVGVPPDWLNFTKVESVTFWQP